MRVGCGTVAFGFWRYTGNKALDEAKIRDDRKPRATAPALSVARFEPVPEGALAISEFSREDYNRDPAAYLAQVVPGRAFQVLSPRPDLPAITSAVAFRQTVEPLGSVDLAVSVVPSAPVTFTSAGLGSFPNKRTSISVAADAAGIARTRFTATRGTTGRAFVFVASPLASGRVRFEVEVEGATGSNSDAKRELVPTKSQANIGPHRDPSGT